MDIEYLEGCTDFSHMDESEVCEAIRFLLDELNAAKFVNCERCVEKTASRCAELAEHAACYSLGKSGMVECCGLDAADEIRREFNLPKAG